MIDSSMIITLDGPSISGKSTVAKKVAHQLGFYCLSSGLLYRSLAYILVHYFKYDKTALLNPDSEIIKEALSDRFVYDGSKDCGSVFFDGNDITAHLKNITIDEYSSIIATNKKVREALVKLQRTIAENRNIVVEGRDCGSVVFPYARYKFFLTASPEIRAQRFIADQVKRGVIISHENALKSIIQRDKRDQERAISPLIIPENAIIIDSTHKTLEETVAEILSHIPSI